MSNSPETSQPDSSQSSTLYDWCQLIRLPNVFTILADVSAAFLLTAQGPQPIARFALIVGAGVALYWAGMVLNDVFDIKRDREERPKRPIASGAVPLSHAKTAGWGLLVIGVGLAAASGQVASSDQHAATWMPLAVAVILAIMIVAYDGPLKRTPLAPAAMGSCRFLSFLLGASPLIVSQWNEGLPIPTHLIAIALGFGIYITGITTMARNEATGGRSPLLQQGLMLIIIGCAVLAFAPRTADQFVWHMDPLTKFPIMIGLVAFPVIMRGVRAVSDPSPVKIQTTIRVGILSIIPFSAAYAFLGAGPVWGLAVFALAVPSLALASRFRVT